MKSFCRAHLNPSVFCNELFWSHCYGWQTSKPGFTGDNAEMVFKSVLVQRER